MIQLDLNNPEFQANLPALEKSDAGGWFGAGQSLTRPGLV
jgi:hypothetical protein